MKLAIKTNNVAAMTDIPRLSHKVALVETESGRPVYKVGETVGNAPAPIERGEWVHPHNLESANLGKTAALRSKAYA